MQPDSPPTEPDDLVTAAMDARTAHTLRTLLADRRGEPAPPLDGAYAALAAARLSDAPELAWVVGAAGFDDSEVDQPDTETLLELLASTMEPTFLRSEEGRAVHEVDHIRWLSLVTRLVRLGPGTPTDPDGLLARIEEVAPSPLDEADREHVARVLRLLVPAWQAVGALDAHGRLTPAGAWLLPRAACYAWDTDFDDPEAPDGPGRWEILLDDGPADFDEDEQALVDAAVGRLAEAGALSSSELVSAVVRATGYHVDTAELVDLLRGVPELMPLRDGRLLHLPGAMDGVVLTHRLLAVEADLGALLVHPDLAAFVWMPGDLSLAGGGSVGVRYRRGHPVDVHDALVGPDRWLGAFEVGDLVALRIDKGTVSVERVDDTQLDAEAAERTIERLVAVYEAVGGANLAGGPIDMPELLLETLARAPLTLSRPQPPLSELLDAAGLDLDADDLGIHGDRWDEEETYDRGLEQLYGLDEAGLQAHHALLRLVSRVAEEAGEPGEAVRDALPALVTDPVVVQSVADMVGRGDTSGKEALRTLALAAHERARGRGRAGAALLRARSAEHLGLTEEGEALLDEALAADPQCWPALIDAAWYAEDRGNAARAVSLLRRAGVTRDDAQLERLAAWAAPASLAKVGRNEPCPCGSGRKYKVCCQRSGSRPLAERAGWLLDKAGTFAHRPRHRPRLLPLVEARAGDPGDPERLVAAIRDSLVQDLGLFEEGLLAAFLDERGVLLPADELALGRSWVGVARSLYEVVDVLPGERLTLLDLRGGERLAVVERRASEVLRAGEAVFARVLPVGEQHVLAAGTVRVPVQQREKLLAFLDTDPNGPAQAAWVATLEAPPRLVTTEGEATVFCEATYEVADAEAARRALDERYERHGGDVWGEAVDTDSGRWTRGTLHLEDGRLVVRTNAVPRLDRLKRTIAELLPQARLIDEQRRPFEEVAGGDASTVAAPALPGGDHTAMGEELAAELDAFVRSHEERWVDEPVPALGGLTPRQAAEDPTRRDQLRSLLDEMERIELPAGLAAGMDAQRLRGRLGIG